MLKYFRVTREECGLQTGYDWRFDQFQCFCAKTCNSLRILIRTINWNLSDKHLLQAPEYYHDHDEVLQGVMVWSVLSILCVYQHWNHMSSKLPKSYPFLPRAIFSGLNQNNLQLSPLHMPILIAYFTTSPIKTSVYTLLRLWGYTKDFLVTWLEDMLILIWIWWWS